MSTSATLQAGRDGAAEAVVAATPVATMTTRSRGDQTRPAVRLGHAHRVPPTMGDVPPPNVPTARLAGTQCLRRLRRGAPVSARGVGSGVGLASAWAWVSASAWAWVSGSP